jgi:hypothetical protein
MSSGFFFRLKEDETMADDVSNTAYTYIQNEGYANLDIKVSKISSFRCTLV